MSERQKFLLHSELKKETHELHLTLHRDALMKTLMNKNECSLKNYTLILATFYVYYTLAEEKFSTLQAEKFPNEASQKAWLENDFKGLNISLSAIHAYQTELLDECRILETIKSSYDHYLGFLYVKQGSTLGAQVITQRIQNYLGLNPATEITMFSSYGENTETNWQHFLTYLDTMAPKVAHSEVLFSACTHFESLAILFQRAYQLRDNYVFQ